MLKIYSKRRGLKENVVQMLDGIRSKEAGIWQEVDLEVVLTEFVLCYTGFPNREIGLNCNPREVGLMERKKLTSLVGVAMGNSE